MAEHEPEEPRARRRRSDRPRARRLGREPRRESPGDGSQRSAEAVEGRQRAAADADDDQRAAQAADDEQRAAQAVGRQQDPPRASASTSAQVNDEVPATGAPQRRRRRRSDAPEPASERATRTATPQRTRRAAPGGLLQGDGRHRLLVVAIGLAVLAVALVAALAGWLGGDTVGDDEAPDVASEVGAAQPSLVLITVDDAAPTGPASRLSVLAQERATGQGTVLLLPTTTIADVPGHGTFSLGEAHELGGASLIGVTVANLLGIGVDGEATISTAGWTALLDTIGGVQVTVRAPLSAADGSVAFEPGEQVLTGERLAAYLTMTAAGETELDALPRVQQVLGAVLDAVRRDPELVDRWLDMELADGSPVIATEEPALVRALLLELAEAREADDVTTWTLPVVPLGSGRDDGYRVDVRRTSELVADRFGASQPGSEAVGGRDVEILNGNGRPRVGQEVAERLSNGGYRIVLTGNADRFTYDVTRIILHDRSPVQLAVGRDVQARLGVGELELAATPGSVVDVTIVVGADFPPDDG